MCVDAMQKLGYDTDSNPPPPSTLKNSLRVSGEHACLDPCSWHAGGATYVIIVLIDEATRFLQSRMLKQKYVTNDLYGGHEQSRMPWAGHQRRLGLTKMVPAQDMVLRK